MSADSDALAEDQPENLYVVDDVRSPSGLPASSGPLFGRDDEVIRLVALLRTQAIRLVTITGPGGVGKTRLALAAGQEIAREFDSVRFVQLAPTNSPAIVPFTIAAAVGASGQGGEDLFQAITASLGHGNQLLVLDNFEHVMLSRSLVVRLLDECADLTILITSRAPLRLRRENEYPLTPLDIKDGVDLYLHRARAIQPGYAPGAEELEAIESIVRNLDGLPLAIELAAAKTRLMSARAIDRRLKDGIRLLSDSALDLPARFRSLEATITWSYDLLVDDAAKLFRRLSVFSGGASADMLERLCSRLNDQPSNIWETLEDLIVQSLVMRVDDAEGEPRYAMLSTIKQFGRHQLEMIGEFEKVQAVHAAVLADFVEQVATGLDGNQNNIWIARAEADLDNVRAALSHFVETRDPRAQFVASGLWRFWHQKGYLNEGRSWIEQSFEMVDNANPPILRALRAGGILALGEGDLEGASRLLHECLRRSRVENDRTMEANSLSHLGVLAEFRGDLDRACDLQEQAAKLFELAGDSMGREKALGNLGNVLRKSNRLDEARSILKQGLEMRRASGDLYGIAASLESLAGVDYELHDFAAVATAAEESLKIRREIGDRFGEMFALNNLGSAKMHLDDLDMAQVHLERSRAIAREIGDRGHEGEVLNNLGGLSLRMGAPDRAVDQFGESLELLRVTRGDGHVAEVMHNRGRAELDRCRMGDATRIFREALELARASDRRDVVADSLEGLAATFEDDAGAAATVCAAVAAFRSTQGVRLQPFEQAFSDLVVNNARVRLRGPQFDRAVSAGSAMSLDEAADFARMTLDRVSAPHPSTQSDDVLSPREKEVLILAAQGKTYRVIGDVLNISPRTAEKHMHNVIGKLNVESRSAALAKAVRMGLV